MSRKSKDRERADVKIRMHFGIRINTQLVLFVISLLVFGGILTVA